MPNQAYCLVGAARGGGPPHTSVDPETVRCPMHSLIAGFVFLGLAGAVSAEDGKFVSKEGMYTVTFPGKPTTRTEKVDNVNLTIVVLEKGDNDLLVVHSDLATGCKDAKPKDILDTAEKPALPRASKRRSRSRRTSSLGTQKFLGSRDLTGRRDSQHSLHHDHPGRQTTPIRSWHPARRTSWRGRKRRSSSSRNVRDHEVNPPYRINVRSS